MTPKTIEISRQIGLLQAEVIRLRAANAAIKGIVVEAVTELHNSEIDDNAYDIVIGLLEQAQGYK